MLAAALASASAAKPHDGDDGPTRGQRAGGAGLAPSLRPAFIGRTGDLRRFANLGGVQSVTGTVPKIDESGLAGATEDHQGCYTVDPRARAASGSTRKAKQRMALAGLRTEAPAKSRPGAPTGRARPSR
jgi:hypothetical protein